MNLTEAQRKAIVRWAHEHPEIDAVRLYGSRAKGTARPGSDVDLAISLTGSEPEAIRIVTEKFRVWSHDLSARLCLPVHLEPSFADTSVADWAEEYGVPLYP